MHLSSEIRSRIEPDLKEQAQRVLDECGLNLSDAIRLFLRQIVATGGLPFEIKTPNANTRTAILETRQTRAHYESAKDLTDDLKSKSPKKRQVNRVVR